MDNPEAKKLKEPGSPWEKEEERTVKARLAGILAEAEFF
jgi:hypothetical protein